MKSPAEFRTLFPVTRMLTYLDTGQRGLTSPTSTQAAAEALQAWEQLDPEGRGRELPAEVKSKLARLLQVDADELAFCSSTTQGLNITAQAIDWQPGDNVVISAVEHASNFYPWANLRQRGVELRLVPSRDGSLHPADYAPFIDQRTRAVSASLVTFDPGGLLPARELAELVHEVGALFVLDAVQAVGILPVYPRELGADVLVSAAYKGLMSAHGTGFFYVAQEVAPRLHPPFLGMSAALQGERGMARGQLTSPDYQLLPQAALFQTAGHHLAGLAQLNHALDLLLALGVEQIGQHVCQLARQLAAGLDELGYRVTTPADQLGSIVCVQVEDGRSLVGFLAERNIRASARRSGLRMAFHAYNSAADVERALEALAEYPLRS